MIGLHPYRHPYDIFGRHPEHASSAPALASRRHQQPAPLAAEPQINTDTTETAYRIHVSAPEGFACSDKPRASLDGRSLTLRGVLESLQPSEYMTVPRTGVYALPGRQLLGVAPSRTVLRGAAPTHSGWVELDDEEGFVHANDLRLLSRPPRPQRFEETLSLPVDALLQQASSSPLQDGGLLVTVPRRKPQQAPPKTARAPQPPPTRAAPAPAPATARPAYAPAPSPAKPAVDANAAPASAANARRAAAARPPPAQRRHDGGGLPPVSAEGPVLMEVPVNAANVQRPAESAQDWLACPGGGFKRQ